MKISPKSPGSPLPWRNDPLDYGMVMPHDVKTLRTLMNIFIYSAVKLNIPMPTSVANKNPEDDDAENEAKQAVNEAGLNGAQSLSWRARMVILRSIFAGAEDAWPKVYDHLKGVAEW